jgi:hypothetical protein
MLDSILSGTDIQNRFLSRWPPAAPRGGANAAGEGVVDDSMKYYLEAMLDVVFRATNSIQEVSPVTGFVAKYPDEIDKQWYPRISDFAEFCGAPDLLSVLPLVAEVVDNKESRFVMDEVLATALELEMRDMLERGDVAHADAVAVSGAGCVMFNAYTFHVNARNASILVGDVSYDTETSTDYDAFRDAFLSVVKGGADAWGADAAARAEAQNAKVAADEAEADEWTLAEAPPPETLELNGEVWKDLDPGAAGIPVKPKPFKTSTLQEAGPARRLTQRKRDQQAKREAQIKRNRGIVLGPISSNIPRLAGGLRERRPLYSNARSTDNAVQLVHDEGLRERRRTRRAPRVRQSTHKSRSG